MQILDKVLNHALGGIPRQILEEILDQKLQAQKVDLSKKDRRRLVNYILKARSTPLKLQSWPGPEAVIQFTSEDSDRIDEIAEKVSKALPELIKGTSASIADEILETLKINWPSE